MLGLSGFVDPLIGQGGFVNSGTQDSIPGLLKRITNSGLGVRLHRTESFQRFIEDQAFLRSYVSAPRPLPSATCLSLSVFLCVAGGATNERGGGAKSQIIRPRESLAL